MALEQQQQQKQQEQQEQEQQQPHEELRSFCFRLSSTVLLGASFMVMVREKETLKCKITKMK